MQGGGADGEGAPAQRPGAGVGIAHAGPPRWTSSAVSELPAARGGVSQVSTRASVQGRPPCRAAASFRGQNLAHAAWASGRTGPGLVSKLWSEEKSPTGLDVRPVTPTRESETERGGAGALVVVPSARGLSPQAAARRRPGSPRPDPCRPAAAPGPGRGHRSHSQMPPLPCSWSAFPSSCCPPPPTAKKISFKFSLRVSNVHGGI